MFLAWAGVYCATKQLLAMLPLAALQVVISVLCSLFIMTWAILMLDELHFRIRGL